MINYYIRIISKMLNAHTYLDNSVILLMGIVLILLFVVIILQIKSKHKLKHSLNDCKVKYEVLSIANDNLKNCYSEASTKLKHINNENIHLSNVLSKTKKDLEEKYNGLEKEHNYSKEQIKILQLDVQERIDEVEAREGEISRLIKNKKELEQKNTELHSLLSKMEDSQKTSLEKWNNKSSELEGIIKKLQTSEQTLLSKVNAINEELFQSNATIQDKENVIKSLNNELEEKAQELQQSMSTLKSLDEELETAKEKIIELTKEINNLKSGNKSSNIIERLSSW